MQSTCMYIQWNDFPKNSLETIESSFGAVLTPLYAKYAKL